MKTSIQLAILALALPLIKGDPNLRRLRDDLLSNYDKNIKPDGLITVSVDINPKRIELCGHSETMSMLSWDTWTWKDNRFVWDPSEYGNIAQINLKDSEVWIPDVVSFHEVDKPMKLHNYEVIVYAEGKVMMVPSVKSKTYCQPNYENWPYGVQNCTYKVGSWQYSMKDIDVQPGQSDDSTRLQSHTKVLGVQIKRDVKSYGSYGDYPFLWVSIQFQREKKFENGVLNSAGMQ